MAALGLAQRVRERRRARHCVSAGRPRRATAASAACSAGSKAATSPARATSTSGVSSPSRSRTRPHSAPTPSTAVRTTSRAARRGRGRVANASPTRRIASCSRARSSCSSCRRLSSWRAIALNSPQRGELVVALGRHLHGEVAAAEPARRVEQPRDLRLERARDGEREPQGEDEEGGEHAGDDQPARGRGSRRVARSTSSAERSGGALKAGVVERRVAVAALSAFTVPGRRAARDPPVAPSVASSASPSREMTAARPVSCAAGARTPRR